MKKFFPLPDNLIIVADESVDFRIIKALRGNGFDIVAICELSPSISDKEVLQIAVDKNALLITEDKDFGELVFRLQLPHKGILLIRINDNRFKIESSIHTIKLYFTELKDRFSVLADERLRIRQF